MQHALLCACTLTASAELYCERAQLGSGQEVLELGCGWGSFSLYAAASYPNSKFTAVSNSRTQREFIMAQAKARGIGNLNVSPAVQGHAGMCMCDAVYRAVSGSWLRPVACCLWRE